MKKYAYSSKATKWFRRSNILYFFFAWNAFGLCMYEWYTRGKDTKSDWGKMSGTQKYISMISQPDDEVKVIQMKGVSVKKTEEMTAEDYIKMK